MNTATVKQANDVDPSSTIQFITTNANSKLFQKTKKTFQGKNVLLTGASGGLGTALAFRLASCHVQSLLLSGRNVKLLQRVAVACTKFDHDETGNRIKMRVYVVPCDLADPDAVSKLGKEALRLCNGMVDVLVNNGGISSRSKFLDTHSNVDELVMKVNYFAGAALAKAVIPGMVERGTGGMVIWISSLQGFLGTPFRTSYAASKFAVQGYCEALRPELTTSGVSVHVASPGYIHTNLSRSAVRGDGSLYGMMDDATAKGAHPDDVAVDVLNSVAYGKTDFLVATTFSTRVAMILRIFFPWALEMILVRRYLKNEKNG